MQDLERVGLKQPLSTKIIESHIQKTSLLGILPAAPGAKQSWAARLVLDVRGSTVGPSLPEEH